MPDISITHALYGQGQLVLFDHKVTADGQIEITKCIACRAEGDHAHLTFEHTTANAWHDQSSTASQEVRISVEDLIALLQAYLEILA